MRERKEKVGGKENKRRMRKSGKERRIKDREMRGKMERKKKEISG